MLGCFIYLFIGLVIGIILYKIDSQLDVMELDIIGNIFLWPITLIVLFSLMVVYFLMIIDEIREKAKEINTHSKEWCVVAD